MGVTGAVLVLAFAGLLWSTLREGTEYFQNVSEVMQNRQAWEGKPLRLHGYVVPGSIFRVSRAPFSIARRTSAASRS